MSAYPSEWYRKFSDFVRVKRASEFSQSPIPYPYPPQTTNQPIIITATTPTTALHHIPTLLLFPTLPYTTQ